MKSYEKLKSANAPNSVEFEELQNFRAMGRICLLPPIASRVNLLDFVCLQRYFLIKSALLPNQKKFKCTFA